MSLLTTPLDALHRELGARMVPFAGYEMPVQYPAGILREHQHTREQAALFDVSHMGQVVIEGPGTAALLERLVPADVAGLAAHSQSYALLTNDEGGVRDDLIITRWGEERFFLVVNAACKAGDIAYLEASLDGQSLTVLEDRALLALQGPAARAVLTELAPDLARLPFLRGSEAVIDGVDCYVTCSGYTGEDGFELSLPAAGAEAVARRLLAAPSVAPAGLGARDSLRLEAGPWVRPAARAVIARAASPAPLRFSAARPPAPSGAVSVCGWRASAPCATGNRSTPAPARRWASSPRPATDRAPADPSPWPTWLPPSVKSIRRWRPRSAANACR